MAQTRVVLLCAAAALAAVKSGARNDWKTLLVIVIATDGYRAVFSGPN